MPDQPRTFPPKMFFLVIWVLTLALALYGVVVSPKPSLIFWIWLAVTLVALRQIWTMRWVQVDAEAIRVRNIAQRGRELRWENVSKIEEQEIAVRKEKSFRIVKVTGEMASRPGRPTTIVVDSDTVGFDVLLEIIRTSVGGHVERIS